MDAFMENLPLSKFRGWLAYFHLENEEAKEAARDAELEAAANARAAALARRGGARGGR